MFRVMRVKWKQLDQVLFRDPKAINCGRRTFRSGRTASQEQPSINNQYKRLQESRDAAVKLRNQSTAYYAGSVIMFFTGLSCVAVPFYRYLCKRTGWGGVPMTDSRLFTPDKVIPLEANKRIRVSFTCQASGVLPWKFTPLQKEVYVVPGETALVFYKAKNLSKEDITGMATYSVSPDHAAPYFNKIQCFCFEEQRLAAGEEVHMPVFFFLDPEFAKEAAMRNIDDIVLNYSFFKASNLGEGSYPVPLATHSSRSAAA